MLQATLLALVFSAPVPLPKSKPQVTAKQFAGAYYIKWRYGTAMYFYRFLDDGTFYASAIEPYGEDANIQRWQGSWSLNNGVLVFDERSVSVCDFTRASVINTFSITYKLKLTQVKSDNSKKYIGKDDNHTFEFLEKLP